MHRRLAEVAKRYKPNGVSIKWRKDEYLTPAHAIQHADGTKDMYVPKPTTREALFVYLHECGHHHLGHCKPEYRAPLWRQEYEAEQWTIATMRREGIAVPRSMIMEAKKYVGLCADIDREKGRELPTARIQKWIKSRDKKRPPRVNNFRRPKTNG
jgi:hypothetical protein